jgi:hypothetical protein
MRVALAATAMMAVLAAAAMSADRQVWGFLRSDGEAQLFYGVPDSGSLTIAFVCEAGRRHMAVVTAAVPRRPKKGQSVSTTLRNGAVAATYAGKLGYTESEGFYAEASAAFEPATLDVVRYGTALTISVPGKQARVPLRSVAPSLAKFEAACFRRG